MLKKRGKNDHVHIYTQYHEYSEKMITRFLELEDEIKAVLGCSPINAVDRQTLREFCDTLKVVVEELFSMESDKYVSLSLVFPKLTFLLDNVMCESEFALQNSRSFCGRRRPSKSQRLCFALFNQEFPHRSS